MPPSITAISPVTASTAQYGGSRERSVPVPAEVLDPPNPVTPATAAVHIMQVPASHVVQALVAMQRALGEQDAASAAAAPRASARASDAQRLAKAVARTAVPVARPAGDDKLDVSA